MRSQSCISSRLQRLFFHPLRGWREWLTYLGAVLLFICTYFYLGNELIRQTNLNIMASDQAANLWLARESAHDAFPLRSNYIQPLWPWVSTFVMQDDDQAYFVRGKRLNLIIGCASTLLIFVFGAAAIAPIPGYMLGFVTGFSVFLQRSHFFHPEPLLYTFFAGAVACMLLSLRSNRWWLYAGWGGCLGVAYLAKASVSPLLAVYAGATMVLLIARIELFPRWFVAKPVNSNCWRLGHHLLGSLCGLILCAAIVAPNALYKLRVHDDPFFSPTKYWMWCDDWDSEAYLLFDRISTARARANFPPTELPTLTNYLRKYGWQHALERLNNGMYVTATTFILPGKNLTSALLFYSKSGDPRRGEAKRVWRIVMPARGLYVVALTLLTAFLFIDRLRIQGTPLFRTAPGLAICAFVVALTLVYWLAFGWYEVIGKGERFSLMLYTPLLLSLAVAGYILARDSVRRVPQLVFSSGLSIILVHAIIQILRLLIEPQFGKNFL